MARVIYYPSVAVAQYDVDAATYFAAIEAADGQVLEASIKTIWNNFFLGAKQDGFFSLMKAAVCMNNRARTLAGALVPLVGPAPTSNGTTTGIYNRVTGITGNNSFWLDTNRNNNADPQNSNHNAIWIRTYPTTSPSVLFGCGPAVAESGANNMYNSGTQFGYRSRSSGFQERPGSFTGFAGTSRSSSTGFTLWRDTESTSNSVVSQTPYNGNNAVFAATTGQYRTNASIAFYSIGEFFDLALLRARVTTLFADLAALSL